MTYTIGMFHYQVGRTDGVSLEMDKWRRVLEGMGHTVHYCAGDLGSAEGVLIPEMYHHTAAAERLYANTFVALRDDRSEAEYRQALYDLTDVIAEKFRRWVQEKDIDFLIPQNVWSVAVNPAVAIAVTRVMRDLKLPALAHNHDFYWERVGGIRLTCSTAVELADKYIPPHDESVRHVVINSLAQRELAERKGVHARVVPNVFDFAAPPWQPDAYNADFRQRIGLRHQDVMILQATRVVARKGIELAVDLVQALDSPHHRAQLRRAGLYDGRAFDEDSRIVLVLAGYVRDDVSGAYVQRLKQKIKQAGIDVLFIGDLIDHERRQVGDEKVYSLWDAYVYADFVTYPSWWEGWGNQLLEAVRAQLPIALFEYPVYVADIKDAGFRVVSFGDQIQGEDSQGLIQVSADIITAAAEQVVELLVDARLRQEIVEHNFRIADSYYSLPALREHLRALFA
ncbi:MAG: glycosyltransferase family 4 protein [Chloroflexi bacterium]|nr:glycosyltransferase family 4 protein [Chloroflexota bacterium]